MKIKYVYEDADLPVYKSIGSAGLDLYAHSITGEEFGGFSFAIPPYATVSINTGIAVAIPEGYMGLVLARSGLATRNGLRPANCVGLIDSDYRGQILVALHNDSEYVQYVKKGSRIAQLVIVPYLRVEPVLAEDLGETERGAGGFGSTGVD